MIHDLYERVFKTKAGPDRGILRKRLDQLYNYERLVHLKTWWGHFWPETTIIDVGSPPGDLVGRGRSRRISTDEFHVSGARRMRTISVIAATVVFSCATILPAQEQARQSPAVTKIKLFGAKVECKESDPGRPVVAIDLAESDRFGDSYVPLLDAFPTLERLDLSKTRITDAGAKRLPQLPALTELNLSDTDITDVSLADLRKFKSLRRLDLDGTQITDAGIRELGNLQTLTELNMAIGAAITDAALKDIARLRNLVALDLSFSSVSDVGLAGLRGSKSFGGSSSVARESPTPG